MNLRGDLIPGIYNHCDTWCERCLFTNRCQSFQIQSETGLVRPVDTGGDLVQQLTDALNLTKQYIDRLARIQQPTGLDAPTDSQTQLLEESAVRHDGPPHYSVTVLANEYLKQTGACLQEEVHLLKQTGQQQGQAVELGLRTAQEVMPMLHALKDAWEMIRWYRTLIPVKIQSALRARTLTGSPDDPQPKTYYLGKAKLVLVSIDQSLLAWQTMLRHYPEKTDDLLDLLVLLSQLRQEMEMLFPEARAFQRLGLD